MESRKWLVLLCAAYLPLVAAGALTMASSIHAVTAQNPARVVRAAMQSAPAPPQVFAMNLFAPAEIDGQVLARGEYVVNWWREGDNVIVSFAQENVVRAKALGQVAFRPEPARYSVVLTKPTPSGTNAISEIQFEGKGSALVFNPIVQSASTMKEND